MLKKSSCILAAMLTGLLSLACDNGQLTEANKLVDEGNSFITKNAEVAPKAAKLLTELVGDNLSTVEDLDEYKTTNKAKFDELISLSEQLVKNNNDAAAKFEAASKLNAGPKFKEYTGLKAQELKKRSELDGTTGSFVKAFVAEKETEKMEAAISEYNEKSAALLKSAEDTMKKADQIVKDNPAEFKSN